MLKRFFRSELGAQLPIKAGGTVALAPSTRVPDINSVYGNVVDRKKWYWYDTLKLIPGATVTTTPYSFFATGIGQADPYNPTANTIKTKLETNINPPGNQFSSPYDMVLNNLGFLFSSDNRLYDIKQIMKYCYLEFKILDKIFFEGHLWRHPPGAGLSGFSTRTSESFYNNGIPAPGEIYHFGNWAKYIPPLTRFSLTLTFPESVGTAMSTLTSDETANGQVTTSLPTLLTSNQGGNGIWLIAFMNGLSDGPVQ